MEPTGEPVQPGTVDKPAAPHGLRLLAALIDAAIVVGLYCTARAPRAHYLLPALVITYHTLLLWLVQQTAGKALVGLRAVGLRGKPRLLQCLGRSSLGYFFFGAFGIGFLVALANREHRCLHDTVFRTRVVWDGRMRLRGWLDRLAEFVKRQEVAVKERTKTAVIVLGFWAFLRGIATKLSEGLGWLSGDLLNWVSTAWAKLTGAAAGQHVAAGTTAVLTTKGTTATVFAMAVLNGAAITFVPVARDATTWVLAPPPLVSRFAANEEGWQIQGGELSHDAAGHLVAYDTIGSQSLSNHLALVAPERFLGDLRRFDGGSLFFDARLDDEPGEPQEVFGTVLLEGKGASVARDLVPANPDREWRRYVVPLEADAWGMGQEEWASLLADVQRVVVVLETGSAHGGGERVAFDNVGFRSEPAR